VTSVSPTACRLDGPPKLAVIEAGSATMATTYHADVRTGSGGAAPGPGLLDPGDSGVWSLFWENWCGKDLVATSVVVTMPDGSGPLVATIDNPSPGPASGGSNPRCDVPTSPSTLNLMAFEYQPPQPPEVVPEPASATISAPPTATIGQDLSFTLTLTNLGDAPAVLDPCPIYDESLIIDGARLKAEGRYLLNCPALGPSLAPGAAVVLAMKYTVPSGLQPGPAELIWGADPGGPFDDLGALAKAPIQLVAADALVPALTVDHPTVTFYPSTGLIDGQEVTVHVTGFGVGGKVRLSECATAAAATALGCGAQPAAANLPRDR
jgi:Neocarzinostatin family